MVTEFSEGRRYYEKRYTNRVFVPENPIIARLDWRAFSRWTRSLPVPYHQGLAELMHHITVYLVQSTQARVGYTQSDEISLLYYYDNVENLLFGGREFKYISILASKMTKFFCYNVSKYIPEKVINRVDDLPECDCRIFDVPTKMESIFQLVSREDDATRNSKSKLGRSYFSHNELYEKNGKEIMDMLMEKYHINWNDFPAFFKRGQYVIRKRIQTPFTIEELEKLPEKHHARTNPDLVMERWNCDMVDLPPIRQIENPIEVFYDGADVIKRTE